MQTGPREIPARAGVIIIGAGVTGCSIARELTKYTPDVVIIDKETDVSGETTKANNAEVHSGIGEKTGTLKQKLNVRGNAMYDEFVDGLGVDFQRQGLLIVVTPRSLPENVSRWLPGPVAHFTHEKILPRVIMRTGTRKGIPGLRVVSRDEIFRMEPHVTKHAIAGVFDQTYGMVAPYKLTIALAELAVINGARVLLDTDVTGVNVEGGRVTGVVTNRGAIEAPIVVNAAGVFSDQVADLAGSGGFKIHARKGASLLFDRDITRDYVRSSVSEFRMRRATKSKGGGAMPTLEGNLQLGPTAIDVEDRYDTSISAEEIEEIFDRFYYLLPDFPRKALISAFSGIRAAADDEDFHIGASETAHGFVNVAGIQSPGLASAPAIAEMVLGILHELGVPTGKRPEYEEVRPAPPRFAVLDNEERDRLIKEDPRYGRVVCRCETVTEAEVVRAIHGVIGATTMDAVKRRTRVGMGRCQGGFCGYRVAEILARELGVPVTEITKNGRGSEIFVGETKGLIKAESG